MRQGLIILFVLMALPTVASFDDSILKGSTDVTFEIMLRGTDDGQGETGESNATVTCYYMRQGAASATAISVIDGTLGSHADGGFKEIDATNMPGYYQFHAPDACFASGADAVSFHFKATGVLNKTVKYALVNYNPRDGVRLGLTALPNAAADAAGGLVISDAGALDIDGMNANVNDIEANTDNIETDTQDIQSRLPATLVSGRMSSDMVAVSGDITSADNLELQYDTTGLTGDTFPATQAQANNFAVGSGGISTTAESFTKAGAEPETNSYTDTVALDGTLHQVEDDGGATDCYYQFDIGGNGVPQTVTWWGYANSNGDSYTIYAYNYNGTAYEQIGTINGTVGSTVITNIYDLTSAHVGTGANIGKVRFRFLSADGTAFATDRVICTYTRIAQSAGYQDGAIWVDSAGTAGSEDYVNGTADNPCPWANALTISASIGINRFHIKNGNTVTLAASADDYTMLGANWNLALGGQSIVDTVIVGAHVTGIGVAASEHAHFEDCNIGAVTLPPSIFKNCGIGEDSGTFTAGSDGEYVFEDCMSLVPGSESPAFVFTGLGASTGINNRRWAGGATYTLDSDCTLSHEVLAGGHTSITQGGADVEVRGITRALTAVLSGAGTVQFVGTVGPITLSGTATTTVNLYGVASNIADTSVNTTVNDLTINQVTVAAILGDTNEVQGDWTNGGRLDTIIDTIAQDTTTDIPADIAGLNDISTADVATELATYDGPTRAEATSDKDEILAVVATAQSDLDTITGADGVTIASAAVASLVDDVWDEAVADHLSAGSTGNALNAAGAAGDPWTTTLPGAYGAGTAGYLVGTYLDAAVSGVPTTAEFNARTLVAASYFDPAADTVATVTTLTGHTPQTGDSYIRLGAPAGASIAADIAAVPTLAEIWAQAHDGAETVLVAIKKMRAVLVGEFTASGSPRNVVYEGVDKATSTVDHTLATDGGSRTEN